jgi:hypothetical protein
MPSRSAAAAPNSLAARSADTVVATAASWRRSSIRNTQSPSST